MKLIAKGTVLPEPCREGPGRTLEPIQILLLVRDESNSRTDSISTRGLVHLIIRYSDDPAAKNPIGFVPYEQRFPRTNDQSGSHAVRFTKREDSINVLSDLCPLNWWGLRSVTPIAQRVQDLALIISFSSPETLKKRVDSKLNSCGIPELLVRSSIIGIVGKLAIATSYYGA